MTKLLPIERARAEAILTCTSEANLGILDSYAEPQRDIAVYGVYPTGIEYAGALAASLRVRGRDVTIHTYRRGYRFNKKDVEGRRVLVVQESAAMNGTHKLFENAAKASLDGYINPDDFRVLIATSFQLMTIEDALPGFTKQYKRVSREGHRNSISPLDAE